MYKNPPDLHTYDHTLNSNRYIPPYNVRIHQYGGKYVEQHFQKLSLKKSKPSLVNQMISLNLHSISGRNFKHFKYFILYIYYIHFSLSHFMVRLNGFNISNQKLMVHPFFTTNDMFPLYDPLCLQGCQYHVFLQM